MSFTPTSIANLILWLDASDNSTITFSSGSNVSQWNDKSTNLKHMTQATASKQPIVRTMPNGLKTLDFSGNRFLQNTSIVFPNAPYTVFAIGDGNGTSYGRLLNGINDGFFFLGANSTGVNYASFVGNGSAWVETNVNVPNYNCNNLCMMEFTNSGTSTGLIPYFNGNVQNAKNGTTSSFTGLTVGRGYVETDQCWNGYVCEVVIYSSILTSTQRQQVEGYLAWKWGLQTSLPTNHTYYNSLTLKVNSNIVVSPIINTLYGNAIFNINATTNNTETPIVYTSGNTTVAMVDTSGNVIVGNVGSSIITLSQTETTNYLAGNTTSTINVARLQSTITVGNVFNKTYGDASFNLSATTNNTETSIVYVSGNTTVSTVDQSGIVTVGNGGSSIITLSQAQTTNYTAITANTTVNVARITSNISVLPTFQKFCLDPSFNLSATTNNPETSIVYTSGNTTVATVNQGIVTIGNAGTSIITLSQAQTVGYTAITANTTLNVSRITSNISVLPSFEKIQGTSNFLLNATTNNTETAIQYVSGNTSVASVDQSGNITLGIIGNATITLSQSQTTSYTAVSANTNVRVYFDYPATNAFDNSLNTTSSTEWRSALSTYNATTGAYTGSISTTYNTSLSVSGEWLQLQLNNPKIIKSYHLAWFIDSSTNNFNIPKSWMLMCSTDATNWTLIDTFDYGVSTPPTNTSVKPVLIQLRNTFTNTINVRWYRLVVTSIFPGGSLTYARISEMDLYESNSNTLTVDHNIKPILTKTHVLHPTTIIPFSASMGKQTVYNITDLDCNLISNNTINNGSYNTNIINGLETDIITSTCFDGQSLIATPKTGNICYISNDNLNTNLNFDISLNGSLLTKNITGNVYASCFNGQRILLGGEGGNVITYSTTLNNSPDGVFKAAINANNLMTKVNGLASNSGYGFVYVPNRIYMNPGDKVSVIAPKSYNKNLSGTNTISMNLNNATIVKNINLPSS